MGGTTSILPAKQETMTDPEKDRTLAREITARVNAWRTPSGNFFNITNPALRRPLPVDHLDGNLPFYAKAARAHRRDPVSPSSTTRSIGGIDNSSSGGIHHRASSPRQDFFGRSPGNSRPSTSSASPPSPLLSPKRVTNLRFEEGNGGRMSPLARGYSSNGGSPRVSTPERGGTPTRGVVPQVKSRDAFPSFSF
eukprot:jgi/Mesvir1/21219/Mv22890-RA.1